MVAACSIEMLNESGRNRAHIFVNRSGMWREDAIDTSRWAGITVIFPAILWNPLVRRERNRKAPRKGWHQQSATSTQEAIYDSS